MARFRGTVQGARGKESRLGRSSMTTECNGWDSGVTVNATCHGDNDGFMVYLTGGSNRHSSDQPVLRSLGSGDARFVEVFENGEWRRLCTERKQT